VTVVGLAKSGIAAARLLRQEGATVRATDAKTAEQLGPEVSALQKEGVTLFLGGHPDECLAGADLVVTSPGVPENAKPLAWAASHGVEVIGELELAWRLLPKTIRVIAITGSNGKSTTTALTGHLLAEAFGGAAVWVGGNIGRPLSDFLTSDFERLPDWAVVEVSSFMLETAPTFAPHIAAILNVSANHLDRHPTLQAYAEIKARIWKNATSDSWTVFNRDDAMVASLAARAPGRKASFGAGTAAANGAGFVWTPASSSATVRFANGPESYSLDRFPAPGAHNAANAAAAILMARLAGANAAAIEPALATFRPLEHRLEKCGEARGVRFYNDSKATTSEALGKSIAVFPKSVVLAGGKDKGGDFKALGSLFKERVKKLVTFGTAKDLIADALAGTTAIVRTPDLPAAFAEATKDLSAGDVVLFSPACASYDQFANFEERGKAFKKLAASWVEAHA